MDFLFVALFATVLLVAFARFAMGRRVHIHHYVPPTHEHLFQDDDHRDVEARMHRHEWRVHGSSSTVRCDAKHHAFSWWILKYLTGPTLPPGPHLVHYEGGSTLTTPPWRPGRKFRIHCDVQWDIYGVEAGGDGETTAAATTPYEALIVELVQRWARKYNKAFYEWSGDRDAFRYTARSLSDDERKILEVLLAWTNELYAYAQSEMETRLEREETRRLIEEERDLRASAALLTDDACALPPTTPLT